VCGPAGGRQWFRVVGGVQAGGSKLRNLEAVFRPASTDEMAAGGRLAGFAPEKIRSVPDFGDPSPIFTRGGEGGLGQP
jgi:hypothetical protein